MSSATIGRNREYRVRNELVGHGWRFIGRFAASKGSGDLLMGSFEHGGLLVQVGGSSKSLGPADRTRFLDDAWSIGAIPVLAQVIPRLGIVYRRVTPGLPATWESWNPEEPNA